MLLWSLKLWCVATVSSSTVSYLSTQPYCQSILTTSIGAVQEVVALAGGDINSASTLQTWWCGKKYDELLTTSDNEMYTFCEKAAAEDGWFHRVPM
jgi:hypothetical protein